MWNEHQYQFLRSLKQQSLQGGGAERIEKQHTAGKLTARERLDILFDTDTFVEIGGLIECRSSGPDMALKRVPGDGVVTGYGKINGRLAFASSEDFTVMGGTLG